MADATLRYATGGPIPAGEAATSDDPPPWLTRCQYGNTRPPIDADVVRLLYRSYWDVAARPAPTNEPWPAFLAGSA